MANSTESNNAAPGATDNSIGYFRGGGIYKNNAMIGTSDSYTTGDVIGILYHVSGQSIKFYKNGVLQYTATAGNVPTGPLFAMLGTNASGASMTANFGATSFTYAPEVPQTGTPLNANDIIGVALDMDAGMVYFYKNGVSTGVTFSGITGTVFPMISVQSLASEETVKANFGNSAFSYQPPAGFNPGFYSTYMSTVEDGDTTYVHNAYIGDDEYFNQGSWVDGAGNTIAGVNELVLYHTHSPKPGAQVKVGGVVTVPNTLAIDDARIQVKFNAITAFEVFLLPPDLYQPLTGAVWQESDPSVILSNGGLTAMIPIIGGAVRASIGFAPNSGKYYWEITGDPNPAASFPLIGVMLAAPDLATLYTITSTGEKYNNTVLSPYSTPFTPSEVLGFVLDTDAWTLTVYRGGVSAGVMFNLPPETYYPCVVSAGGDAFTITANFTAPFNP